MVVAKGMNGDAGWHCLTGGVSAGIYGDTILFNYLFSLFMSKIITTI